MFDPAQLVEAIRYEIRALPFRFHNFKEFGILSADHTQLHQYLLALVVGNQERIDKIVSYPTKLYFLVDKKRAVPTLRNIILCKEADGLCWGLYQDEVDRKYPTLKEYLLGHGWGGFSIVHVPQAYPHRPQVCRLLKPAGSTLG